MAQLDETTKEGLFPDLLELGWKSAMSPSAHLHRIFDEFDKKYNGVISAADLERVVNDLGGEIPKVTCQVPMGSEGLNLTEFLTLVTDQYSVASPVAILAPPLKTFCDLSNLHRQGCRCLSHS